MLNLELIRMPPSNLEYVLVHEMVNLLGKEPHRRFYGHMDRLIQV